MVVVVVVSRALAASLLLVLLTDATTVALGGRSRCARRAVFSVTQVTRVQWVGDHMPPTALLEQGNQSEQMFYAQCVSCSNKQGGIVRKNKALVGSWPPIKYFRSQVTALYLGALFGLGALPFFLLAYMSHALCSPCCQRLLVLPDTTRSYVTPHRLALRQATSAQLLAPVWRLLPAAISVMTFELVVNVWHSGTTHGGVHGCCWAWHWHL